MILYPYHPGSGRSHTRIFSERRKGSGIGEPTRSVEDGIPTRSVGTSRGAEDAGIGGDAERQDGIPTQSVGTSGKWDAAVILSGVRL